MSSVQPDKVSAAVWQWRDRERLRAGEIISHRRRRVLIQSSVALTLGATMLLLGYFSTSVYVHLFKRVGTIASCVGVTLFVIGNLIPGLYDGMDRFVAWSAQAVGRVLNWVLLTPFFYLCFLPARLILLAKGRDPMTRKCPSDETTFWIPRPPRRDEHFTKQY